MFTLDTCTNGPWWLVLAAMFRFTDPRKLEIVKPKDALPGRDAVIYKMHGDVSQPHDAGVGMIHEPDGSTGWGTELLERVACGDRIELIGTL